MKEAFEKFTILWSNKKSRAYVLLALWAVFLALVSIYVRTNTVDASKEEPEKKTINYVDYNNYEYTFESKDLKFSGAHYENKSLLTLTDGSQYYIEDDILYKKNGSNLTKIKDLNGHSIVKLQPKYLGKLINDAAFEYSVSNEDGSIKNVYSINSTDYYKLYNTTPPKEEFIIPFNVYMKNKQVIKLEFSDIEINYKNIGNVSAINVNY